MQISKNFFIGNNYFYIIYLRLIYLHFFIIKILNGSNSFHTLFVGFKSYVYYVIFLMKQIKTKQNKTKQNKTKQNKTKHNKPKQNKPKQNKTKQNKTKQIKT